MKALLFIFSLLLILLFSRLWVGMGSYPERWRTTEKTTILKAANEKKQGEIDKIQAELDDAKSGKDAVEEESPTEAKTEDAPGESGEAETKPEDKEKKRE